MSKNFTVWDLAVLEKLVEKEILAQPDAARINGQPCGPGPYVASLYSLMINLQERLVEKGERR